MQKRSFQVLTGAVVAVFLWSAMVEAQDDGPQRRQRGDQRGGGQREGRGAGQFGGRGGMGLGRGGDLLSLIRINEVRKEINLEKSQEESIDKITEKLRGERGERRNFRDLSDDERAKLREEGLKRAAEAKKDLAGVLNEQQMRRLTEIQIQVQGVAALNDDEVAAKLELTDEQIGKIEVAEEENREKFRTAMQSLRDGDRDEARQKMTELRESAEKNVMALLTKDQQAKFEAMKGKKFDMPRGGRFGGRGDRPSRNRERRSDS